MEREMIPLTEEMLKIREAGESLNELARMKQHEQSVNAEYRTFCRLLEIPMH